MSVVLAGAVFEEEISLSLPPCCEFVEHERLPEEGLWGTRPGVWQCEGRRDPISVAPRPPAGSVQRQQQC